MYRFCENIFESSLMVINLPVFYFSFEFSCNEWLAYSGSVLRLVIIRVIWIRVAELERKVGHLYRWPHYFNNWLCGNGNKIWENT